MPTRPKISATAIIPAPFAQFMGVVATAIDERDECAWTESDDLLQCDRAYGGLIDEAQGRYGFTYFIDDDEDVRDEWGCDRCWNFYLDRQQIREIAKGMLTVLEMWRCEPDCGRRFPATDYYCPTCDFHPEPLAPSATIDASELQDMIDRLEKLQTELIEEVVRRKAR